jgi:hypothetical protein
LHQLNVIKQFISKTRTVNDVSKLTDKRALSVRWWVKNVSKNETADKLHQREQSKENTAQMELSNKQIRQLLLLLQPLFSMAFYLYLRCKQMFPMA